MFSASDVATAAPSLTDAQADQGYRRSPVAGQKEAATTMTCRSHPRAF